MAERRQVDRLNTPGSRSRLRLPRLDFDPDTFGRFAEGFARFMGTAKFLGYMTIFVIVWVTINVVGLWGLRWDPYPFILLNLVFSTQASYSAPLILLAQNRQEARDRLTIEEDRRVAAQSRADMDFLAREIASIRLSLGEIATRDYIRSELRNELRELLADLDRDALPRKSGEGKARKSDESRAKKTSPDAGLR